jgi:hypothetical protein
MLRLITDIGDSALFVPASALLLAYLLYLRRARTAVIWASTLALCAGLTIVMKIGFHGCGADLPLLNMRSPSGHASFSTTFYACFALMIAVDQDRWKRLALLLASTGLVLLIAIRAAATGNGWKNFKLQRNGLHDGPGKPNFSLSPALVLSGAGG